VTSRHAVIAVGALDYGRRPIRIKTIPTIASSAPQSIQMRWSSMKLEAGQWI
jgi:hypothetical protein